MSKQVTGFITWIRTFLDDVYAPKGSGGGITIDDVYPVGSIYMSVDSTSPATLFGGTWQKIEGRFLLASGTTSGEDPTVDNTYTLGDTDGEATHTLTVNEMPSHHHAHNLSFSSGTGSSYAYTQSNNRKTTSLDTGNMGGGQAHNNMPPYLVVNVWERTG